MYQFLLNASILIFITTIVIKTVTVDLLNDLLFTIFSFITNISLGSNTNSNTNINNINVTMSNECRRKSDHCELDKAQSAD